MYRQVTRRNTAATLDLNERKWQQMEILLHALKPFEVYTNFLSNEKCPSLSKVQTLINFLLNNFLNTDENKSETIKDLKTVIKNYLEKRTGIFSEDCKRLETFSTFMDSRYKKVSNTYHMAVNNLSKIF